MAFFDDKKMLLAHIRHSFVTSDDTGTIDNDYGMCELIMVNEEVEQEIQNDHTFQKKSLRMQQRFKQVERRVHSNVATSYDIQASPTLSRRPPMKSTSDMFQIMEERKKKASQVKSVPWQATPLELIDKSLFSPQPIKPRPTGPSPLTKLLAEQAKKTANPFFKYSKYNGENHGSASTNKYYIFLAMAKDPLDPLKVTVLHTATVEDLIGFVFWKYTEEGREQLNLKSVQNYSVMIADDDGEIDIDLPELQRDDFISKFGFKYLGIVESQSPETNKDDEDSFKKYKIVKVYYENGGFSTIAVESMDIEMSEVLTRVIRKRRLQIHGYELERKDSPGEFVNLRSSLSNQGTMDFMLVRNIRRLSASGEENTDSVSEQKIAQKVILTGHRYESFNVTMIQRMRSNTRVQLGVDSQRIEVQPIDSPGRGFLKAVKPMNYDINEIYSCEILEERLSGASTFRIVRIVKEGLKNMDFEAPHSVAKEIVAKVNFILADVSSTVRTEYDEKKDSGKARRGSKLGSKSE